MKLIKIIGTSLLVLFILFGIFTAFANGRRTRNVAMSANERVKVERIYSYDGKTVYLVTVDGVEYLYFRSPYAGGFVKK